MNQVIENDYAIYNCDCIQGMEKIPDDSIGFSIFSPPFVDLYTYSEKVEDLGNCEGYDEFFYVFNFLARELFRTIQFGRNVAIHCMDLPIQKGKEGYIGLRDFSGKLIETMQKAGFIYYSRVTIWKNPVVEMQRTKALGLLHKQLKKDSARCRVGIPDYLLLFRKDGENLNPIKSKLTVDIWQQYASPVWMDINQSDTLNFREARSEKDERHLCPLQIEVIERALNLWSNEGDIILSPFMGIGSEGYVSLKMGRKFIGMELKQIYFEVANKNLENVIKNKQEEITFEEYT